MGVGLKSSLPPIGDLVGGVGKGGWLPIYSILEQTANQNHQLHGT